MTRLNDILNNHEEIRWTQDEIADWVASLPESKRNLFLDTLKEAQRRGLDIHRTACKLRSEAERIDTKNAQPWYVAVSNAMIGWSLGGLINGNKKLT